MTIESLPAFSHLEGLTRGESALIPSPLEMFQDSHGGIWERPKVTST